MGAIQFVVYSITQSQKVIVTGRIAQSASCRY